MGTVNWPKNHAARIRGLDGTGETIALVMPRPDFTWFVEFRLNPDIPVGLWHEGVAAGRVTAAAKSVQKPSFSFDVETIKAYNQPRMITKKMEWKDITVTFYDDTTSYITGLLKSYRMHKTYQGLQVDPNESRRSESYSIGPSSDQTEKPDVQNNSTLLNYRMSGVGPKPLPSMGIRPQWAKFFEEITIYDMGTETNSINIYHMIDPVIKDVSMGTLDYSSSSFQEITITFGYESMYDEIGISLNPDLYPERPGLFETQLQIVPDLKSDIPTRAGVFNATTTIEAAKLLFPPTTEEELERQGLSFTGIIKAIQRSIQGGEINFDNLSNNLFKEIAKGTPIQNLREFYKSTKQIKQAIDQGRFTDVVALLGNVKLLGGITDGPINDIFKGAEDQISGIVKNADTWLSKHTNNLPPWISGG
jgi:hypothetical protein